METTLDTIGNIKMLQPVHGYRFSLDAVLLYSFVNIKDASPIADLGAGSGIVGILLAKKYPDSEVNLFEVQVELYALSVKNISLNGLAKRVKAHHMDITSIKPDSAYGIVVSNPPFRKPTSGLLSGLSQKAIARHEIMLTLDSLCKCASGMLRDKGRLCIIHHPERLTEILKSMSSNRLEPKRIRFVHGTMDTAAKMVLIEAVKNGRPGLKTDPPLFVYQSKGVYSEQVKAMF